MRFVGVGFLIPCSIVIGYYFGLWLDGLLHTHFLYIVFLLLGAAGGLAEMVRQVQGKPQGRG